MVFIATQDTRYNQHRHGFQEALVQALKSECSRRRCGAVIIRSGMLLGWGYSGPPAGMPAACSDPGCEIISAGNVHDAPCCVHAEERAIRQAVISCGSEDLSKAFLYFISVSPTGEPVSSGDPYCLHCANILADTGCSIMLWETTEPSRWSPAEYLAASRKGI